MINKTENYKVVALPMNQDFVNNVYVLFPLHSKFSWILNFISLPVELSKTTAVQKEFWEKR